MSRVNKPISIPAGTTVTVNGQTLAIKGGKGAVEYIMHPAVAVQQEGNTLTFTAKNEGNSNAIVGTTRALVGNVLKGTSEGFEKKLELVGVGYRAQVQGKMLNLSVGFSHPVNYPIPNGIAIETPTQTEVVVKGTDRQLVGQVAADIRGYRPPEPYKGKGIRYSGEVISLKEAKKK